MSLDQKIRLLAFDWLSEKIEEYGSDVLPYFLIKEGFLFNNDLVHLISPKGIHKPKQLDMPLTVTTSPNSKYDDGIDKNDFLHYDYRGTDPYHPDNVGLRKAMEQQVPLIYFLGLIPGKYLVVKPVYIVGDDPSTLTFTVAADSKIIKNWDVGAVKEGDLARRMYATSVVKTRLHQRGFRERVIAAYRSQCSFCKLRHIELLDASHIIPDNEDGPPTVDNGLSLCKIHHTAFDRQIIGVTPDYDIDIRADILEEEDGPMLRHGLQELHGQKLILPKSKKDWPNKEYLDRRYQKFARAI